MRKTARYYRAKGGFKVLSERISKAQVQQKAGFSEVYRDNATYVYQIGVPVYRDFLPNFHAGMNKNKTKSPYLPEKGFCVLSLRY